MTAEPRLNVVIVGGGVAGLEALMALRDLAEDRAEITLAAPDIDFTYKPLVVEEPFSGPHDTRRALGPIVESFGARFVQQPVVAVDVDRHELSLGDGSELGYEVLIVCIGARGRPAFTDAVNFDAGPGALELESLLTDIRHGRTDAVTFVVPPGVTWPLPIYELALMTKRLAGDSGVDLRCTIVTPEETPLVIFGPEASSAVTELLAQRGIDVITGAYAGPGEDGGLVLMPGERQLEAGRIVALPIPEGPDVKGLPSDQRGFIPIDSHGRVQGVQDVYAAGDGTTFPIKQGGLATQQADAAAAHVAARAGAPVDPKPFRPILRGKLLTGATSLYVRHEVHGAGGESRASEDYLWWPPHKIVGRYLAPWLAHETAVRDAEPAGRTVDVEVSLPEAWHEQPMALDPYAPFPN